MLGVGVLADRGDLAVADGEDADVAVVVRGTAPGGGTGGPLGDDLVPAVRTLVTSSATVDPGSSAVPTLPRKSSTMVSRPRQVPDSGRSPGYSQMASSAKLSRIAPLSPSRTA